MTRSPRPRRPRRLVTEVATATLLVIAMAAPAVARPIIPDEPVPLSPLGGTIIDTTPEFTWFPADNATTHEIKVMKGKKALASATGIVGTSWVSPVVLPIDVDLTWKVRGISAAGRAGPWSSNQPLFRIHPPVVGDVYGGGLVAYVLQPGDPGYVAGDVHGLVVGPYPWSFGGGPNTGWYLQGAWWRPCLWDYLYNYLVECYGGDGPIGTSTDLGTGAANTAAIAAYYGSQPVSYAAAIAEGVSGNGFSDWYLPSKDELTKLYLNKQVFIDNMNAGKPWMNFAGMTGGTSFITSSEVAGSAIQMAWFLNWNDPNLATAWNQYPVTGTSTMILFRSF